MMTTLDLSLAILALLATPGPTNTLMFIAGAERGFRRAARLIPAELAGYLSMVVPLTLLGSPLFSALPQARTAVAFAAGLWVALLALRLWRLPSTATGAVTVGWRGILVTTVLNPKALIFGLVLLPDPQNALINLALFAPLVMGAALLWLAAGAWAGQGGKVFSPALPFLRRAASLWLAALSVVLVLRGTGLV